MEQITSTQNPKVKQINRLRDKRGREQEARFVIDDTRDLVRALDCNYQIDYVFYCEDLDSTVLKSIPSDATIYAVSRDVIQKASYRQNPSSVVAVMKQKTPLSVEDLPDESPLLALVNLKKPGNIGALLRTADATGFRSIVLIDTSLDIYNPNIIRSSTGACFLDNIYLSTTPQALTHFQQKGYKTVAAAVDGSQPIYDIDLTGNIALLMGTEDVGLDDFWLQQADYRVQIPMVGKLSDSLNVSVSGAIFMYEALRQKTRYNR